MGRGKPENGSINDGSIVPAIRRLPLLSGDANDVFPFSKLRFGDTESTDQAQTHQCFPTVPEATHLARRAPRNHPQTAPWPPRRLATATASSPCNTTVSCSRAAHH